MTSNDLPSSRLFINGEWREAEATLTLVDPSTGERLTEAAAATAQDVDSAVRAAHAAAQGSWGALSAKDRGRILMKMARLVDERIDDLAALEARDVGKPLRQAKADAVALSRYLEFYAGAADKIHGETIPYEAGYTVYTLREPFGVTAHIIPWNYPMQIIGRSVVAALSVGNAAVLKPAEDACLTALIFGDIAQEAGLPAGALNIVTGRGEIAGAALSAHPLVDHISFTGSFPVGAAVQASAANNVAPVTLELGGKSPQIIFDDADLERALPVIVNSGVQNAGQTCSAGSRILIQRNIFEATVAKLAEAYQALRVGPAMDDFDLGPLISAKQLSIVEDFLGAALDGGLEKIATGAIAASAPSGGFYCAPSLWRSDDPAHRLAQEEVFGPVQVVMAFDDEAHAVALANGTPYGLSAGVWTRDGARQMRLAKSLKAGQVFLNNYGAGGGAELPFGGVKQSGHGREKGFEALYGFSTLKTVAAYHG